MLSYGLWTCFHPKSPKSDCRQQIFWLFLLVASLSSWSRLKFQSFHGPVSRTWRSPLSKHFRYPSVRESGLTQALLIRLAQKVNWQIAWLVMRCEHFWHSLCQAVRGHRSRTQRESHLRIRLCYVFLQQRFSLSSQLGRLQNLQVSCADEQLWNQSFLVSKHPRSLHNHFPHTFHYLVHKAHRHHPKTNCDKHLLQFV